MAVNQFLLYLLHCIALHCTEQNSTVQSTALHCTLLYHTVLDFESHVARKFVSMTFCMFFVIFTCDLIIRMMMMIMVVSGGSVEGPSTR